MRYEQMYKVDREWEGVSESYVRMRLGRFYDNVDDVMECLRDGQVINTRESLFRAVKDIHFRALVPSWSRYAALYEIVEGWLDPQNPLDMQIERHILELIPDTLTTEKITDLSEIWHQLTVKEQSRLAEITREAALENGIIEEDAPEWLVEV